MPSGQSVPLYTVPQTSEDLLNLGRPLDSRSVAAGIMIITAIRASMLNVEPTELNLAIHFVGAEEMTQWMSINIVVIKNV